MFEFLFFNDILLYSFSSELIHDFFICLKVFLYVFIKHQIISYLQLFNTYWCIYIYQNIKLLVIYRCLCQLLLIV